MFSSASADIVTDASGNATVYLTHGLSRKLNGLLYMLKYTPGTIDTAADLTITSETNGTPILVKANAGTDAAFYYPRSLNNAAADGSAGTCPTEMVPIQDERIKVVVTQGGNAGAGSIKAVLLVRSPY